MALWATPSASGRCADDPDPMGRCLPSDGLLPHGSQGYRLVAAKAPALSPKGLGVFFGRAVLRGIPPPGGAGHYSVGPCST